jgi:peptidoglycan/LPS O-acetylase OafA/YrhL
MRMTQFHTIKHPGRRYGHSLREAHVDTLNYQSIAEPAVDSKPAKVAHLDGVDALRGLAALMIVLYHFFANSDSPEFRVHGINLFRPLNDGWCAVNLFLVLSGFCLYWPYARDAARPMRYGQFMRRRCFRILPAYYMALILVPFLYVGVSRLGLCTPSAGTPQNAADVLVHLAMLHSFTPRYFGSWNGVSWSLGLEWTWYLAFPIALLLFRRLGPGRAMLVLIASEVTYRVGLYLMLGPARNFSPADLDLTFTLRTFLLGRVIEFGLGMYVASILVRTTVSRFALWSCALSVFPLLGIAHWAERFDVFLPIRDILYGLAASVLLVVLASRPQIADSWKIGRFFRAIGVYSYSLYLFHMPFVHFALGITTRWMHLSQIPAMFAAMLFTPVILLASKGAFKLFEMPFLNLRGSSRRDETSAPQLAPQPAERPATMAASGFAS